jgi:HSP20 family protein
MPIHDLIPWSRRSLGRGNDLNNLQGEMNRLFDDFWNRFHEPFGNLPNLWGSGTPKTDVVESESEIEISVELPGMEEKDIDVTLSDNVLTIRGEKKSEREEKKKDYHLSERSYGSFSRSLPLPSGVDTEQLKAEFKKGVLTIRLPKTPEAKSKVRKIDIQSF